MARTRDIHTNQLDVACDVCGRMVEVEVCGIGPSLLDMEKVSGFRITRHQLTVFGVCPDCQAAK